MKILNFGSLNKDMVYEVDHFVKPGETIASKKYSVFCGGKGLNQSIALARAGIHVFHAGKISKDGEMLVKILQENGVDVSFIATDGTITGHAIIQINKKGENCILLYGGANKEITQEFVDDVLDQFESDDILVLQNEICNLEYIINRAYNKGMRIALNPSPIDDSIKKIDINKIHWIILNEIEGKAIAKTQSEDEIINRLLACCPDLKIILTLGEKGSIYGDKDLIIEQPIFETEVVDTTAAGDTFLGYYLSGVVKNKPPEYCLMLATAASSLTVSKKGASSSIPVKDDVKKKLLRQRK